MSWFHKKTPITPNTLPDTLKTDEPDKKKLERDVCFRHLGEVIASPQHGVVLKVYIENFKRLNQVFGHDYCDELLEQILTYLKEETGKPVYHYIGVEFIIILDKYTLGLATDLSEEIAGHFDRAWKVNGTDCLCSVQLGLCSYPGHAISPEQMLKCLDLAILKGEECGPNQVIVFDSALQKQLIRKQTIALYLKTALKKEEVEIRFRPTIHVDTGMFTRAELYMRIFIKGLGLVGASEVLPVAEDSGQIRAIEYFALEKAGQCIQKLIEAGRAFDSIALPISSVLFLQEDFLDEIKRVIQTFHIPRGKLAIEIQESALTMAYLNINVMLQELEELGVELILNEFGSGYSGISTILDLPVNTLKLERLFVWQLETNPKSKHIIKGLVRMARELDLNIIAEGVETENQVQILTEAGCHYQQGFYYSPTLEQETLLTIMGSTLADSLPQLAVEKDKMSRP